MSKRIPVLPALLILLLSAAALWGGEQKPSPAKRPGLMTRADPFHSLADIAEVEPNGSPAQAQALTCGDSFRPAALLNTVAGADTDWISFTANAGDFITFETAADAPPGSPETDTVINLIASDGVTSLASNDDAGQSTRYSRISTFPAPYTGIYYGKIRGFEGAQGSYRANLTCITPPPQPVNDQCAGAITIPYGTIALSGSTQSATNDYDLCPGQPVCPTSCTGFSSQGRDVVYRLDVARSGDNIDVVYNLTPQVVDAAIYVVTDCNDVHGTCIAGQDAEVGTPEERLNYTFAAAGTYFLILDAFEAGGALWTLNGCLGCLTAVRPAMSWGRLKSVYR